jgi:hypothetical protein
MIRPAILLLALAAARAFGQAPPDSAPPPDSLPAFRHDSTKAAAVRSIEAGGAAEAAPAKPSQADSLDLKLRGRGPFVALTAALSFSDLSAKQLFTGHLDTVSRRDSLRLLQRYDPVHVAFPFGLTVGIPVSAHLDLWLRSEHFWYRPSALAQGSGEAREFEYAVQGHLFGAGVRYLIPASLLSVTNRQGLYFAYTHFWNAGPTEIYAPTGKVRAKTRPAGAGYEIQAGYQQDFDKRWTLTGGLAFANIEFQSRAPWRNILPYGPDETARWTLRSLRLSVQGMYQFGRAAATRAAPPRSAMPEG